MKIFKLSETERNVFTKQIVDPFSFQGRSDLPKLAVFDDYKETSLHDWDYRDLRDELNVLEYISHAVRSVFKRKGKGFVAPHVQDNIREGGFELDSLALNYSDFERDVCDSPPDVLVVSDSALELHYDELISLKNKLHVPLIVSGQMGRMSFTRPRKGFVDTPCRCYPGLEIDESITTDDVTRSFLKNYPGVDGVALAKDSETSFWHEGNLKQAYEHATIANSVKRSLSLDELLIKKGFFEEHVAFISDHLQKQARVVIVDGVPVGIKSKNKVYYLQDVFGTAKTIKFYEDEKEARMEAIVNYFFPFDKDLATLVPGTDQREPSFFTVDGTELYVVIENDVRVKASFNEFTLNLNKRSFRQQYFSSWMHKLAVIHVKGTQMMNMLGNYDGAKDLFREKDKERIDAVYGAVTLSMLEDANASIDPLEAVFINQDLKLDNRIGEYVVDWGGSGRGHPYTDLAMVLNDPRSNLSEGEKRHYLSLYLKKRQSLEETQSSYSLRTLDAEFAKYKNTEFAFISMISAFYETRNAIISPVSEEYRQFLFQKQDYYQTQFNKKVFF